jgi:hypothetical protein
MSHVEALVATLKAVWQKLLDALRWREPSYAY